MEPLHLQAGLALMVSPPKEGDPSYEQHRSEEIGILDSLRRRAHLMTDGFNACEGVTCNYTEGAMYSFPKLNLPPKVCSAPARLLDERPLRLVHCRALLLQVCALCDADLPTIVDAGCCAHPDGLLWRSTDRVLGPELWADSCDGVCLS